MILFMYIKDNSKTVYLSTFDQICCNMRQIIILLVSYCPSYPSQIILFLGLAMLNIYFLNRVGMVLGTSMFGRVEMGVKTTIAIATDMQLPCGPFPSTRQSMTDKTLITVNFHSFITMYQYVYIYERRHLS